ncbi:hypothetical protein JKP88DRAFT_304425 [Tribonema minus]|uniref:Protein ENHANCED DISEASE RESISTANCE 2 C-terminal domain-containing protein n=1 Tax=Tribonema minus TaxID=303371 RepID=A0A835Z8Q7_9STRA|nr:hypothetical protein JKP88DRAFT_304425 [Tribonema minus]
MPAQSEEQLQRAAELTASRLEQNASSGTPTTSGRRSFRRGGDGEGVENTPGSSPPGSPAPGSPLCGCSGTVSPYDQLSPTSMDHTCSMARVSAALSQIPPSPIGSPRSRRTSGLRSDLDCSSSDAAAAALAMASPEAAPPVAGSAVKMSRRRRLKNFLLLRGRRGSGRRSRRKKKEKKDEDNRGPNSSEDELGTGDEQDNAVEEYIGLPPRVGASYARNDAPEQAPCNRWSPGDATGFCVRTKGYCKSREKGPSLAALYDLKAMDCYHSPYRINDIKSHVRGLDALLAGVPPTGHPDIPSLFIINVQLPNVAPPLSSQGDGPTIHVTMFMVASEALRQWSRVLAAEQGLQGGSTSAPPSPSSRGAVVAIPDAVRLLAAWCAQSEADADMRGRFKLIGDVRNMDTVGLPSFCRKFNARPILIHGRESSFTRDVAKGRAELDVNAHNFSYIGRKGRAELDVNAHDFLYIGRKGLYGTLSKWREALLHVSVLIEGRNDDELPEQVLGTALFQGLDISRAEQLSFGADGATLAVGDEEDILFARARAMAKRGEDSAATEAAAAALALRRANASSAAGSKSPRRSGNAGGPQLVRRWPLWQRLLAAAAALALLAALWVYRGALLGGGAAAAAAARS